MIFFRLTGFLPSSFTGDLRTKSAQNQLGNRLKALAAQAFSRLRAAHRLRTKSVLKQQGDIFDGFLFFIVAGMNIAVHRGLEIRLSQDALDGLHVRASVVQHCSYRVPEDVRRGSMEVHRSVDALHHTSEGSERQRFPSVIAADDKTLFAHGQEVGKQVWNDGDLAETAFSLRRSNEGLIVGVGHIPLNMKNILFQIYIFPT